MALSALVLVKPQVISRPARPGSSKPMSRGLQPTWRMARKSPLSTTTPHNSSAARPKRALMASEGPTKGNTDLLATHDEAHNAAARIMAAVGMCGPVQSEAAAEGRQSLALPPLSGQRQRARNEA